MLCVGDRARLFGSAKVRAAGFAQAGYAAEHVVLCFVLFYIILETREFGDIKYGKKDLCVTRQLQKMCEMCMLMASR